MKNTISTVKGTREFYPGDMAQRNWLYSKLAEVSVSYGYQEYDGPFLEKIDLYAAKSSEELVKEQAFVFQDRGGDYVTLRPELTPSLSRMIAQKQNELVFPARWWSFGPFWRYERPQKGRSREFFQWNIDLLGVDTPEADAELVAIAANFFSSVGLGPELVQIRVNNRKLTRLILEELGVPAEKHMSVFHVVDRRDKLSSDAWEAYAIESGLTAEQLEGLKKTLSDREAWRRLPDFQRFFQAIEALGVTAYVVYDPAVIRGLDYYTGMVFEAYEKDGGRAIFGGGRYDNLVAAVGGDPLPGVGFAMGDVMIGVVLQKYGCVPDFDALPKTALVTVFDETMLPQSFALAAELRRAGVRTVCYPDAVKLQKQLKWADRMGVHFAVIVGPDEAAGGTVTIKDLAARDQVTIARAEVGAKLREMMSR